MQDEVLTPEEQKVKDQQDTLTKDMEILWGFVERAQKAYQKVHVTYLDALYVRDDSSLYLSSLYRTVEISTGTGYICICYARYRLYLHTDTYIHT